MRRLGLILSVAVLATLLVSIATITAGAETSTPESTLQAAPTSSQLSISQGTFTVAQASEAELSAVRRDMAEEERLPDYSQVVDNAQSGRFDAPGWKRGGRSSWAHGGDYVSAGTSTTDARFKLRAPTDGDYALYAWWPGRNGDSSAARFGVKTARGTKWVEADQTKDGGMWVKLGDYEMKAGDRYVVRISPRGGSDEVIADAVALVRGKASPPPADLAPAEGGPTNGATTASSGENVYTTSNTKGERRALLRYGRRHLGTTYRLSPPAPCRAFEKEDCACFTKLVFGHFGKRLVDHPVKQYWNYGRRIDRADLKRGDLVFFKERGMNRAITHVAMYSGNGYVLHASSYYGKVAESKMKYLRGYFGAKRIQLR
jgi:cell wall-associated NlpC family hydrolase